MYVRPPFPFYCSNTRCDDPLISKSISKYCQKSCEYCVSKSQPTSIYQPTWSDWSPWSKCSKKCGSGETKTRTRNCQTSDMNKCLGGKHLEKAACDKKNLPICAEQCCSRAVMTWNLPHQQSRKGLYFLESYTTNNRPVYRKFDDFEYVYYYKNPKSRLYLVGSKVDHSSGGLYTSENIFCPYKAKKWSMWYNDKWNNVNNQVVSYCENCCENLLLTTVEGSNVNDVKNSARKYLGIYKKTNNINMNGMAIVYELLTSRESGQDSTSNKNKTFLYSWAPNDKNKRNMRASKRWWLLGPDKEQGSSGLRLVQTSKSSLKTKCPIMDPAIRTPATNNQDYFEYGNGDIITNGQQLKNPKIWHKEKNLKISCLNSGQAWSDWSSWSPCSITCRNLDKKPGSEGEGASGKTYRTRFCMDSQIGCDGFEKPKNLKEILTCSPENICVGSWSSWSECVISECPKGERSRERVNESGVAEAAIDNNCGYSDRKCQPYYSEWSRWGGGLCGESGIGFLIGFFD